MLKGERKKKKMKNLELLCLGCMKIKPTRGVCPYCQFDLEKYRREREEIHLLQPQTILAGKYMVGKVLGEGGFGITYIGWNLHLEVPVAIKEFFPVGFVTRNVEQGDTISILSSNGRPFFLKQRERFLDEARILAKFDKMEGIVSVRDFFEENGTAYIVMEYLDGEDFGTFIKRKGGKLPPQEVFEMMRPIMRALIEVHENGMIHRDISPDNIRITNYPNVSKHSNDSKYLQVKLMDFGAAREMSDGEKSLSIVLKPGYAPEEQYQARGIQGPWTDVYALCATMYKAIVGKKPMEALERAVGEELPPPSSFGISINQKQEAALMKGLALFRENRWENVAQLYIALGFSDAEQFKGRGKKSTILPEGRINGTAGNPDNKGKSETEQENRKEKKKRSFLLPLLFVAIALLGIAGGVGIMSAVVSNKNQNQIAQREDEQDKNGNYAANSSDEINSDTKKEEVNVNGNANSNANTVNTNGNTDSNENAAKEDANEMIEPSAKTFVDSNNGEAQMKYSGDNITQAWEVENEVRTILEQCQEIDARCDSGECTSEEREDGQVTIFVTHRGKIEKAIAKPYYNGIRYTQYYYYYEGKPIYARYEGADLHEVYFYNGHMFRWTYAKDSNNPGEASNYAYIGSAVSENAKYWESVAGVTAYELYKWNAEWIPYDGYYEY